jgi:hypothetical protein
MATEAPTNEKMATLQGRYSIMPLTERDLVMHHIIGRNKARVWSQKPPDFWGDFERALDYVQHLMKNVITT